MPISDPEDLFAELAEREPPPVTEEDPHREPTRFYPGSKKQIPERPAPPEPEAKPWDRNAKTMQVNGVEVEFFTVGALAEAINRKPVTIRSWEMKGIFPKARYRDKRQRRLYTRRQIEGVRGLCAKHGILDFAARPDSIPGQFTEDVLSLWREDLS